MWVPKLIKKRRRKKVQNLLPPYESNLSDPIYRRNDRIHWRRELEVLDHWKPLIRACYVGTLDEVKTECANLDLGLDILKKCLIAACLNNTIEVIDFLWHDNGSSSDYFLAACFGNSLEVIEHMMIKYGYNKDSNNGVWNGFIAACASNRWEVIEYLVSVGFDPNVSFDGVNGFLAACSGNNLEVIQKLVEEYDYNVLSRVGEVGNGLYCACGWNTVEVVKGLVELYEYEPVDPKSECNHNLVAATCNDYTNFLGIVELFGFDPRELMEDVNLFQLACERGSLEVLDGLVRDFGLDPHMVVGGISGFHIACSANTWPTIFGLQQKYNYDWMMTDDTGKGCFHFACQNSVEVVDEVARKTGDQLEVVDWEGISGWHIACMNGNFEMIQHVFQTYGFLRDQYTVDGYDGFSFAILHNKMSVVKKMIEHGLVGKKLCVNIPNDKLYDIAEMFCIHHRARYQSVFRTIWEKMNTEEKIKLLLSIGCFMYDVKRIRFDNWENGGEWDTLDGMSYEDVKRIVRYLSVHYKLISDPPPIPSYGAEHGLLFYVGDKPYYGDWKLLLERVPTFEAMVKHNTVEAREGIKLNVLVCDKVINLYLHIVFSHVPCDEIWDLDVQETYDLLQLVDMYPCNHFGLETLDYVLGKRKNLHELGELVDQFRLKIICIKMA